MAKSKGKHFTREAYPSEEELKLKQHEEASETKEAADGVDGGGAGPQPDSVTDEEDVSASSDIGEENPGNETETMVSRAELARAVAEAEQRGYQRGRSEAMSHQMRRNGIWEQPRREDPLPASGTDEDADGGDDLVLLRRIRPSIWD